MWGVFTLLYIIGFSALSNVLINNYSIPVVSVEEGLKNSNEFVGERAHKNLEILNNFGPKATGSFNAEVLSANFIIEQIKNISGSAHKNQKVELEQQLASGNAPLYLSTSYEYRNLQNIIAKLYGTDEDNSILVNCHYDSVPGSYGASDDLFNCCVMLEILKVLSQQEVRSKFTIIFLFNDGEEQGLLGSQGFLRHWKDTNKISAFINLESTGSGGKEILFQTSPKHYWLVEHYQKSVNRPFGQAAADELFRSGLIPAATDFEIFQEYRDENKNHSMPGLDFAHFKDGYRYHTANDHVRYITPENVQYTGNNILNLVKSVSNSESLPFPSEGPTAVYYDFLGLFMIMYSEPVAIAVNTIISVISFVIPFIVQVYGKSKSHALVTLLKTFMSFVTAVLGFGLSVLVNYLLALIFAAVGKAMSWYTNTILVAGLYGTPTVIMNVLIFNLLFFIFEKCFGKLNKISDTKICINGINFFFAIFTLFGTYYGLQMPYTLMVILFISILTHLLVYIVEGIVKICYNKKFESSDYENANKCSSFVRHYAWIVPYFIGMIPIILWASYFYHIILELFIPIAGKSGGNYVNPDILIGIICALFSYQACIYFVPLFNLIKKKWFFYGFMITLFVAFIIMAMFTSIGFPYRSNIENPTPQRHYITHVKRELFNEDGVRTFNDSGFSFEVVDFNCERTIKDVAYPKTFLKEADDDLCKVVPYCGMPQFSKRNKGNFYLPEKMEPAQVEKSVLKLESNGTRMHFSLVGVMKTSLYIHGGKSNFSSNQGSFNSNPVEVVQITYGKKSYVPSYFYVEPHENSKEIMITVSTVDSNILVPSDLSEAFLKLLDSMPTWTYTVKSNAHVQTFVYPV